MAIKVYLDEQLRARGITAKELCARVGITEANLSILRSGKAKGVRFHTINRICYYLQCDVGDILKFDGELDEGDCNETYYVIRCGCRCPGLPVGRLPAGGTAGRGRAGYFDRRVRHMGEHPLFFRAFSFR